MRLRTNKLASVVPPNNNDTPEDILLRGVVRIEKAENPEQYIKGVLKRVKIQHIERTYGVKDFDTPIQFLELMARKGGRLLKGGEADVDGAARMVLNDFLRGKLPWFTSPPLLEGQEGESMEGREGVLGKMDRIRSRKDESGSGEEGEETEDEKEDSLASHKHNVPLDQAGDRQSSSNNTRLVVSTKSNRPAKRRKKGD